MLLFSETFKFAPGNNVHIKLCTSFSIC